MSAIITTKPSVISIYPTHEAAESAVKALQKAGFDMKKLSLLGRDYHTDEHVVGYYNTGDRVRVWGQTGAFWGGLWGFMVGSAFFWIPGIGPLLVAGPMVSWIVGALEGAILGAGLSAVGAGLYSIGIPHDSILRFESALKTGKFVLIASGTELDAAKAQDILRETSPETLESHA
jgi:hypothetical protein